MSLTQPDTLTETRVLPYIKTKELGKNIFFHVSLDSTNTVAKELAEKGEPHGTVVVAETQNRGKGRLGRIWYSPPGGLWFSIILRPKIQNLIPAHLTFMSGLAVIQAARKAGIEATLRWPNDIYVGNKKVGGILTETKTNGTEFQYFVIGIGLNVNVQPSDFPAELREEATSFLEIKKEPVSRAIILGNILIAWEKLLNEIYPKQGFAPILKVWKKYASFLGSQVRVDTSTGSLEGEAVDVTVTGALCVQDIDGIIHEVSSGDVRKLW